MSSERETLDMCGKHEVRFFGERGCDICRLEQKGFDAGYRSGLEAAAKVAEQEQKLYEENAARCDASGNHAGGTADTHGALACRAVAAAIRQKAE